MSIERREELLSAYLDGELDSAGRAEVEAWLAESPELRQLRDELAALSGHLRSLPRHQLDHDLSSAVLRRAERAVLSGQAAAKGKPVGGASVSISDWWSRGAGWRRLTWPALALAAALLIMVFSSDERGPERQVAQAPQGEKSSSLAREPAAEGAPQGAVEARARDVAREKASEAKPVAKFEESVDAPALGLKVSPSAASGGSPPPVAGRMDKSAGLAGPAQQTAAVPRQGLRTIVCDVSPEFLKGGSFERLLDRFNIRFEAETLPRGPALATAKEAKERDEAVPADAYNFFRGESGVTRRSYTIEATDAQLAQIVAELRKDSNGIKKLTDLAARQEVLSSAEMGSARALVRRFVLQSSKPPAAEPAAESKNKL